MEETDIGALELLPAEGEPSPVGLICLPWKTCLITCLDTQFPDPP